MIFVKRLISSVLLSLIIVSNLTVAYAAESVAVGDELKTVTVEEQEVKGVDDLNIQLNDLYNEVGRELNINYIYVKILHMLAGGKAVYSETLPNIYVDQAVDSLDGPFDIPGASQNYDRQAPWVYCPDESISRPNKYYLPDAAYNVTADIINIMNNRYIVDRGMMQNYFDALDNSVKTNILFCEAVLQYTGSSQKAIDSFYTVYEKIIYDKQANENVMESDEFGNFTFKPKYEEIIRANGISSDREIEILGIILRFDSKLAASCSTDELTSGYVFPYKVGYTSRENMMIAAMSVVGKVRYVWGGGHLGTGTIDGINPAWVEFYNSYGDNRGEPGYDNCIRPNNGWCPIHATVNGGNGCLFKSKTVYSADQYIEELGRGVNTELLNNDQYREFLESSVNFSNGVSAHRLDGLDCSGYASWLFNQVVDDTTFDSGALRFIAQSGVKSLGMGKELLPGDVYSWGDHIIVIVGKVKDGSKAYVMVESGPNTVKLGVAYYNGATAADIADALKIAKEANILIGNLTKEESTRMFNMSNLGFTGSDHSGYDKYLGYRECGRLNRTFIDENTVLGDYGKKITEMTAQEIIQHTINNLPHSYVSGFEAYEGEIFNTGKIGTSTANTRIDTVQETDEIVLNSELNQ